MRILHRMTIAFGCILFIGIVQGGVSLFGLDVLKGRIEEATRNPLRQVDAARGMWEAYGDAKAELQGALNGVRFEVSKDILARYRVHLGNIEAHIAGLKSAGPSTAMLARLSQAEAHFREWNAGALVLLGDKPATSIPAPYKMDRLGQALRTQLQGLVEMARQDAAQSAQTIRSQAGTIEMIVIICTLLAAIGGCIVAVMAALSLTRPLVQVQGRMRALMEGDIASEVPQKQRADEIGQIARTVEFMKAKLVEREEMQRAAAVAEERSRRERAEAEQATVARERELVNSSVGAAVARLAQKDLTFRLTETLPDAYAKLQSDFNSALEQLEAAIGDVSMRTGAITASTSEVSNATSDLSRRTEQQAASLEETAAALDEITATVKKTAENSVHARDIAGDAMRNAQSTGSVVRKTIDAMGDIEKSSQQINQIIGVIDEIAFQTNLLALNAGVEAARAGDSGRGFAVVASEVRALAQRSAQAAREIKELISRSSSLVSSGVALVAETGNSLDVIVQQVGDINTAIVSIAAGAQEQATGVHEVNNAINQMDQVTQQNAAMVEQTTAASSALAEETQRLQEGVAQFRIGRATPARSAARAPRAPAPRPTAQVRPAPRNAVSRGATALKASVAEEEQSDWQDF